MDGIVWGMSMTSSRITLGDAAKLTGKSATKLKKMAEESLIPHHRAPSGRMKFSMQSLIQINPALSSTNSGLSIALSEGYARPKRLVTISHLKGKLMDSYLRDGTACIRFCRGFEKADVSFALMTMIDLMAAHYEDYQGIPSEPASYLSGLLGITQRKWTQSIEPTLVHSKRIRIATRAGIKVWVFPDEKMTGSKALFKPAPAPIWPERFPHGLQPSTSGDEREWRHMHLAEFTPRLDKTRAEEHGSLAQALQPVAPSPVSQPEPEPEPAPEPEPDKTIYTAYEVLKQAGVDVDNHDRGEFFWLRADHNEVLSRWLKTVPVNEIVARIDKARLNGKLPAKPNGLLAYESIVMGDLRNGYP